MACTGIDPNTPVLPIDEYLRLLEVFFSGGPPPPDPVVLIRTDTELVGAELTDGASFTTGQSFTVSGERSVAIVGSGVGSFRIDSSGTLAATGPASAGIFVGGCGDIGNSGSITASGLEALGIGVDGRGDIVNSGSIDVLGVEGVAVFVDGEGSIENEASGVLTAMGLEAAGLFVDGSGSAVNRGIVTVNGEEAIGVGVDGTGSVTNAGVINVEGQAAGAIGLGGTVDATNESSGSIFVSAPGSLGIGVGGSNLTVTNAGEIQSSGSFDIGLAAAGDGNTVVHTGTTTTTGPASAGIVSTGLSGTSLDIGQGTEVTVKGRVSVGAPGSAAIVTAADDTALTVGGNVVNSGSDGFGIAAFGSGIDIDVARAMTVSGPGSTAFLLGADAFFLTDLSGKVADDVTLSIVEGVNPGTSEVTPGSRLIDAKGNGFDIFNQGWTGGFEDGILIENTGESEVVYTNAAGSVLDVAGQGIDIVTGGAVTIANGSEGAFLSGQLARVVGAAALNLTNDGRMEASGSAGAPPSGISLVTEKAGAAVAITNNGRITSKSGEIGSGAAVSLQLDGMGAAVTVLNAEGATLAAEAGIDVTGGHTIDVRNEGTIETTGGLGRIVGLGVETAEDGAKLSVVNRGSIAAEGPGAEGVFVSSTGARPTLSEGEIQTIVLELSPDVDTEIDVSGALATGVNIDVDGYLVENSGVLRVSGETATGFLNRGDENTVILTNDLVVDGGDDVTGVQIGGTDNRVFNGQGTAVLPDFAALLTDADAEPVQVFSSQFDFSRVSDGQSGQSFPTGRILATGSNAVGLVIAGTGNVFVNVLQDDELGVVPGDLLAIGGQAVGVDFATGGNTVVNSGRIAAGGLEGGSVAISGSDGRDVLVNEGEIFGQVLLGAGDDIVLVNPGASVNSTVDGGVGGDDLLVASGGNTDDENDLLLVRFDGTPFREFERFEQVGDRSLIISGILDVDEAAFNGVVVLDDATIAGHLVLRDGSFTTGVGRIGSVEEQGTDLLSEDGSILEIGTSPGTLAVEGGAIIDGILKLEIGGPDPGDRDLLTVSGAADLAGATIEITFDGFVPAPGQSFALIQADRIVGLETARIVVEGLDPGVDFKVTATEGGGLTISDFSSGSAPVAADDVLATDEDNPLAGDLFADNGAGPDIGGNDALQITSVVVGGTPVVLGAATELADGGVLTVNADGSVGFDPDGDFEALGEGDTATSIFEYTVTGGTGGTDTATVTVEITGVNDLPVVGAIDVAASEDDAPFSVDLLAAASDAEGDPLSVRNASAVASDGRSLAVAVMLNGGLADVTPSAFADLAAGETTRITITYDVSDGTGSTEAAATITMGGLNDDPVAEDDEYSTAFGESLFVSAPGLLGNDTDIDGDTLTATLLNVPENGTLSFDAGSTGAFSYTPDTGFSGTDRFTYNLSDGNGGSDIGTVSILVALPGNTPPVARDDSYTTGFNETLSVDIAKGVLTNDFDPDGDVIRVVGFTPATKGTLTIFAEGQFTYTPDIGFVGQEMLTYTISDGIETATATVTVNVDRESLVDLIGTASRDLMRGTSADEFINGLGGSDTHYGGGGADTFAFLADGVADRESIRDFEAGIDSILLDSDYAVRFTSRYALISTDEDQIIVYGNVGSESDLGITMADDMVLA